MENGTKYILGLLIVAAVVVTGVVLILNSGMIIPPDDVLISQTQTTDNGHGIGETGQTFTLSEEKSITRIVYSAEYYMTAFTSGNVKCTLYQCDANGLPSEIIQDSNVIPLSSLASAYTNITFTFTPVVKASGVIGGILYLVDPAPSTSQMAIHVCYPGVYDGGSIISRTPGGPTWMKNSADAYFIVYGR